MPLFVGLKMKRAISRKWESSPITIKELSAYNNLNELESRIFPSLQIRAQTS